MVEHNGFMLDFDFFSNHHRLSMKSEMLNSLKKELSYMSLILQIGHSLYGMQYDNFLTQSDTNVPRFSGSIPSKGITAQVVSSVFSRLHFFLLTAASCFIAVWSPLLGLMDLFCVVR